MDEVTICISGIEYRLVAKERVIEFEAHGSGAVYMSASEAELLAHLLVAGAETLREKERA